MTELHPDLAVIGAGLGGISAAVTAAELGLRVVLTCEHHVLGGQLTTQAVPPDEHGWIEEPTTSPSYTRLRRMTREYYRRNYPLRDGVREDPLLNPGRGRVSRLCAEPRAFAAVFEELLAPYIVSGRITVLRGYEPVAASVEGDTVSAVMVRRLATSEDTVITAPLYVDATELGDLLELAGVEHVVGTESVAETGELHAPQRANPLDQQAITWCFAIENRAGEDHTIDRPSGYGHWSTHVPEFWPGPQLSWTDVHPHTLEPRERALFGGDPDQYWQGDLWQYRRIVARTQYPDGFVPADITLVNWAQNDYWERPLLGVDDTERAAAFAGARDLSRSLLYWIQTEAPRPDGGCGFPGMRLRGDVLGSDDELAVAPYIRESRRIRALLTLTEEHLGMEMRGEHAGSEIFADSVGLGSYRIDLHPSTAGRNYIDVAAFPFQIPLRALVPERVTNMLPANKNIGTTHITNGAYRLHPVEWSIGEAVGALSAFVKQTGSSPHAVAAGGTLRSDFLRLLAGRLGLALRWPEDIRTGRR